LEVDDPLLVEVQGDDFWYEGYNMRTGAHGIFPAYYAIEIANNRQMTVKFNPPSFCILEISVKGIKLAVQEDYYACDRVRLSLNLCSTNVKI
ncbi:hypothetical protein GOODEAATRI_021122, partial [Goodea atripinnis]